MKCRLNKIRTGGSVFKIMLRRALRDLVILFWVARRVFCRTHYYINLSFRGQVENKLGITNSVKCAKGV